MRSPRILAATLLLVLASGPCRATGSQGDRGRGAPLPTGAREAPSLLLITIDTWRWDYVGASGAGKVETPNLDRLAREGFYEAEVVTPCPLTTPAHASLFTGLLPIRHGVLDCGGFSLPPSVPTLAESFRRKGYSTAAFVAGEVLKARYGLNRGFQRYDDSGMESRSPSDWQSASRDGARVVDAVLEHLAAADGSSPSFIWAHFFDAHTPYRGHAPFTARYPGRPYAAEVAYVDSQIGRLLEGLPREGRPWRIVVVGDHGEGLGDHGEMGHGYSLYRSTLHVPLILSPAPEPALLHSRPWSLTDLLPTLTAWFGLKALPDLDGENLMSKGGGESCPPCRSSLRTRTGSSRRWAPGWEP